MPGGFWGGGFIYISVTGGATVTRKIQQLATFGNRISSLQEPLTLIGEDLLADFARNMATEGGLFTGGPNAGTGWAPLAPSTIRDRIRKGYGAGPILWRTGRLGNSLAERGSPDNIFEVTRDSLKVGTRVPYAKYHHSTAPRKTKRVAKTLDVSVPREWRFGDVAILPRRPLVGMTQFRQTMIIRRLGDYVREQVAAAGLGGVSGGGALP